MEYEEHNDGMRTIYRTYADTEISVLATKIQCPYCGNEWLEDDMSLCGKTYTLTCGDDFDEGCGKEFKMYFDAD
ncbi:hypothetical protein [Pseudogracilibacillus auburnensis]|uniref:hypothetical protein n=1 Tax=Pseudogracilibacillus auburnensis TaxID=1494959 RepID=UPI001A9675B9|nr:hypothetical protein [Pseudogracilibacillus auburnensis]MBO1005626.1 hypothetical protein [Pseudogracilibacillus auburnensis]